MAEETNLTSEDLAYDLRQRYAKIVGDHLEDVARERKERNYYEYFNALESLYVIVKCKFKYKTKKDQKKKDVDKEKLNKVIVTKTLISENKETGKKIYKVKTTRFPTTYSEFKKSITSRANKHPAVWIGESDHAEGVAEIENALRNLEKWLYSKMNEANMFGAKKDVEGLV